MEIPYLHSLMDGPRNHPALDQVYLFLLRYSFPADKSALDALGPVNKIKAPFVH